MSVGVEAGVWSPCEAPATIECDGMWWCAEHYDRWHDIGMCLHADGTMPFDGLPLVAAKGSNG